jgi:hypothetical protein
MYFSESIMKNKLKKNLQELILLNLFHHLSLLVGMVTINYLKIQKYSNNII